MKTIVAFVLGATMVGVSSGVIAASGTSSDVETYNHMNGYWCEVYPSVHSYCDPEVLTYMEENGLWS